MSYQVMGTLFDSRQQALRALAEAYVLAGGNDVDSVIGWLSDPRSLAEDLAIELTMKISGTEDDATVDEIEAVYASVVAVNREESSFIYSEEEAAKLEQAGVDIVRVK